MTADQAERIRTLAFGDIDTGIWGAAAISAAGAAATFADNFELDAGTGESGEWLASAGGLELRVTPTSSPAPFGPPNDHLTGYAEICRVEGAMRVDGAELEVECLGARSTVMVPAINAGSARAAVGWFGGEDGFSVLSLRPPKASGHESDTLVCAIVEEGHPLDIDEPRLSTTYGASGTPSRAGLEVWLVEPERKPDGDVDGDGDGDEDDPRPHYPRRIAGESAGAATRLTVARLEFRAELFRWHARGRHGTGMYIISPAP